MPENIGQPLGSAAADEERRGSIDLDSKDEDGQFGLVEPWQAPVELPPELLEVMKIRAKLRQLPQM
jgi:hypothetical protein